MLRRLAPPHLLLAAYCGGLCLALVSRPPAWLLAAAAGVLAVAIVSALRPAAGKRSVSVAALLSLPALLCVLFLIAGLGIGSGRLETVAESGLESRVGRHVAVRAELTDLPSLSGDELALAVDVRTVDGVPLGEPAHMRLRLAEGERFASDPCGPLVEGAVLAMATVRVDELPAARPGAFDYGRYLRRRGEHAILEGDFADLHIVGRRGGVRGMVDRLRVASRAHLGVGVHPPVSEVLRGMVLGDDEGVDPQTVEDFRRSGLLHILAVSGENVVLLCTLWAFLLGLLAVPRLARTALLVPVVICYVVLSGASPSIVRAGVAGVVGLFAVMVSRPTDGWLLWLTPAAWLLTVNPNNLFDVSFQLSFGAVAGLLLLARPLTRLFRFLPGPLPEQAGITSAASLSTAPISMLVFGSTSLVSLPANLAGGFVLGPIMFLGMLSLMLGFVSSWLSAPLNVVAGLLVGFLLGVAHVFARLPWAVYEWRGVSLPLVLVAALAAEAAVIVWLARRAGEGPAGFVRRPGRRGPLTAATAVVVAAAVLLAPRPVMPPQVPTLTFLNVGEGAATLVQIPDGPTVLVDAGPEPLSRTLREHAVRRVDLLVLSHAHADHVGGLSDVLGSTRVDVALLPRPPQVSAALTAVAAQLRAAGTGVRWCDAPLRLGGAGWALQVLPSSALPGESGNQGENDEALVVLAELGTQRVLVPGDVEGEALARLHLPPCAVVELPHHGSRGGLDEELLAALAPRVGVISVGANRYGHPTQEMLQLLAGAGVPCARTDLRGDVAVSFADGRLRVSVAATS